VISRRQLPGRDALERARALLVEVAAIDSDGPLARGLGRFGSWRSLAAVVGTDWLPLPRRATATTARMIRQRLRALGADPPTTAVDAGSKASGGHATAELGQSDGPVQLRGTCAPLPDGAGGVLWRAAVVEDDAGLWAVEEGNDFVLRGAGGKATLVLAEGGRLVNADVLAEGDEVAVFGLPGEAPDRVGIAGAAYGRGGLCAALRSGPRHPLLLSVIRRYDQGNDGPQD
jgi:hypothetical protein